MNWVRPPGELTGRLAALRGRLAALCDPDAFVVRLAIVNGVDAARRHIRLTAPAFDPRDVAAIHFGSLRLDLAGAHVAI